MMIEHRDQHLEALFAQNRQELEDGAFTKTVVARTHRVQLRLLTVLGLLLVALLAGAWWLSLPLLEFAWMFTAFFATPIVDFGSGWLGWLLLPVNTIGSLALIAFRLVLVFRRKALGLGRWG